MQLMVVLLMESEMETQMMQWKLAIQPKSHYLKVAQS
jgi:hypothetical protein